MKRIMIVTAAAVVVTIAALAVYLSTGPRLGPGGVSGTARSVGEALVGGPFTLTDHTGKRVTDEDFAAATCWSISATHGARTCARPNCR